MADGCSIPDWALSAGYQCSDPLGANYMPGAQQYIAPLGDITPTPSSWQSALDSLFFGGDAAVYNVINGSSVTPDQFAGVAGETASNAAAATASAAGSAARAAKIVAAGIGSFFSSPITWIFIFLILVAVILGLWKL